MLNRSLRMLTEEQSEARILQAIFRRELERGEIEIKACLTPSAALGVAQYTLMAYPDRSVALVVNAGDEEDYLVEERRRTIFRILGGTSPDGWEVILARPDVDAWLLADPAVRAIFEADEETRRNRYKRAARIGEIAQHQPIDREAIARVHPEFATLVAFIEQHRPAPSPTA